VGAHPRHQARCRRPADPRRSTSHNLQRGPRMTAYALISGVIFRAPVQKISKAGKPYTVCTVKVGADDSASSEFWSVLIFSESAQLEMLRLEIGDAVAVRGKLKIETYTASDGTTRISRSILADATLGLRPAPREKKPKALAATLDTQKRAPASQETTTTTTTTDPGLDDEIPF
jgi:hypothetical protein